MLISSVLDICNSDEL